MTSSQSKNEFIADKLMDGANYALAVLVFGLISVEDFDPILLLLGLLFYFWGWATSLHLKKGAT